MGNSQGPGGAHVAGISQPCGFLCAPVMSRMTGMVVTVMASSLVWRPAAGWTGGRVGWMGG